jgi:hypothetical protein
MTDARFDSSGRLHVTAAPISCVGIGEYDGSVIGKGPGRLYRLFRAGDELRRAARSFAGVPLLSRHIEGDEDIQDVIAGTTGTDVEFRDGILLASVSVWDGDCIQTVLDGTRAAVSCGYHFDVDLKPGVYRGERYDGVMLNITGHHVSLVRKSNAGDQCRIEFDFEFA